MGLSLMADGGCLEMDGLFLVSSTHSLEHILINDILTSINSSSSPYLRRGEETSKRP